MANPTSSYSYRAVGNREDLMDVITMISPDQTYLIHRIGRSKAKATKHEWLTDSLEPAVENRNLENTAFTLKETTARKRLGNSTQIFMKQFFVTDTQEAVDKAGVPSEIARQKMKLAQQLNRDLEFAILKNSQQILGDDTVPGMFGGLAYWTSTGLTNTYTNFDTTVAGFPTTGIITMSNINHQIRTGDMITVLPNGTALAATSNLKTNSVYWARVNDANRAQISLFTIDTDSAIADAFPGTRCVKPSTAFASSFILSLANLVDAGGVALTEDIFNDMMYKIQKQGGRADEALVDGKVKRLISTWTAGAQKTWDLNNTKLREIIDIYETDFGMIALNTHAMQSPNRVDFVQLQYLKLAPLINFRSETPTRTGIRTQHVTSGEMTFESLSPQAQGAIFNIG